MFSTYVFMPKRRVLAYSLDPNQPGDQFLFNLFIAPVAILVNLVASLPGAIKALLDGTIHSRVPATILIAIGAFIPTLTDSLNRFGATELFQLGKFLGVVFLFAGFLVSIEVFRDIRIPFTSIRWLAGRHESPAAGAHRERGRGRRAEPRPAAGSRPRSTDRRLRYHPGMAPSPRPPLFGFAVVLLGRDPVRHPGAGLALRLRGRDGADPVRGVARAARRPDGRGCSSPGGSGAARNGSSGPAACAVANGRRWRSPRPVAPG